MAGISGSSCKTCGAYEGIIPDPVDSDLQWVGFSAGGVWPGLSGGPLLDNSWGVVGMVAAQGIKGPNRAVPVQFYGQRIKALLETPHQQFVITGAGARANCQILNGSEASVC
jgi:hypothetical protein